MITRCGESDFSRIYNIINDGASAYKGVIPQDCWKEPYMSEEELRLQMNEGVEFWAYTENGRMMGVMGIQHKTDVTLIRHAYVRTSDRGKGIGSQLLLHLRQMCNTPVLIGTWATAQWAIQFYIKHGFRMLDNEQKNLLLHKYWSIPERQAETSVVLAGKDWHLL